MLFDLASGKKKLSINHVHSSVQCCYENDEVELMIETAEYFIKRLTKCANFYVESFGNAPKLNVMSLNVYARSTMDKR